MTEMDKPVLPVDPNSKEVVLSHSYEEPKEFRPLSQIYFELGRTLFQQQAYNEAAQAFRDAIRKDPNSAQLQIELAQAREAQGRYEDALNSYIEAVRLDPSCAVKALKKAHQWLTRERAKSLGVTVESDWLTATNQFQPGKEARAAIYDFLGRASLYRGDFSRAVEHYTQAGSDDPENLFILEGTGEALWRVGKSDEAIQTLTRAVAKADDSTYVDRRASTRLKLAKVLLDVKRYPDAVPVLQEGLQLKHGFTTEFQIALARCYLAMHKAAEALQLAQDILSHNRGDIDTYSICAAAYYELKQYPEAADAAETALKLEPDNLPAIRLKALALIEGNLDLDQAIRLLQTYTRRKPDDLECQLLLTRSLRQQGRSPDDVVGALDSALANAPQEQQAKLILEVAQVYLEAMQPEHAVKKLDEAQHWDPQLKSQVEFWKIYGEAQERSGQTEAAAETYRQGLEIEPSDLTLLQRYGKLLIERKDPSEAINVWRRVAELAADDGEAHLKLAQLLQRETGQAPVALEEVGRALSLLIEGASRATAYELQGKILESLQRPAQDVATAYHNAGQEQYYLSEFKAALELFEKANKLDSKNQPTYWYLSDTLRCLASTQEYPYVDKDKLNQAKEFWNEGRKISPPSEKFAWAYLCRAFIHESLARIYSDRPANLWEAILALEQMLLLDTKTTYTWPYLARFYRFLFKDAMAMDASERGLALGVESNDVLSERAWVLGSIYHASAPEIVEKYAERLTTPDPVTDALKGYVLSFEGNYIEALRSLEKFLESTPGDVWVRSLRGRTFLWAGDKAKALEEFQKCWRLTEPGQPHADIANRERRAWVGYQLRHYHEAAEIFKSFLDDEAEDPFDIRIMLALCYLKLNQTIEADRWFEEALSHLRNMRHVKESLQELKLFKAQEENSSKSGAVISALATYEEKIQTKAETLKAKIYDVAAAEQELTQLLAAGKHGEGSIAWLAIKASLGRLLKEGERWDAAAKIYYALNSYSDTFPEANIALKTTLDALQGEGERRLSEGTARKALELFNEVLKLAVPAVSTTLIQTPIVGQVFRGIVDFVGRFRQQKGLPESITEGAKKQASLYSRLGYAHFQLKDSINARKQFAKAIELYRYSNTGNPGEALGKDCKSLLRNARDYWALVDEWKAFAASETDEKIKTELAAARNSLADYLDELYQLSEDAASSYELLPVVTPIAVEMGEALIPDEAGPEWSLIKRYLPDMRARIMEELGVPVQGVRVRDNQDLNSQDYTIILNDIPLVTGYLPVNMLYCHTSIDVLRELGIPAETIEIQTHPLTGTAGCWIQPEYREIINHYHLTLLDDPLLFMVSHVEAVLHSHLAELLGIQEVENLLLNWAQDEKGASRIKAVLPDESSRFRFARLLRTLVEERVPITEGEEILDAVEDVSLTNGDLGEAERAVRLKLKKLLPGNELNSKRVPLPKEIEDRITKCATTKHKTVLDIPPEETQKLLDEIRTLADPNDRNVVLVTSSPELRPFVRRLVEIKFPELMVLASEEVVSREDLLKTELNGGEALQE